MEDKITLKGNDLYYFMMHHYYSKPAGIIGLLEHAFSKYGDFPKIPVEIKKSFCYNTFNMYKIFPAFIY